MLDSCTRVSFFNNKPPFIYQVKDKFYVLGEGAYRECTENEIELYHKFNERYEKTLKNVNFNDFGKKDTKEVLLIFEEIRKLSNEFFGKSSDSTILCKINELLVNITQEEFEEICQQHKKFEKAIDWQDGAYYRTV